MALVDFMKKLQEEDSDVIYSKPPEDGVKIIPPVKVESKVNPEKIKIIPPKEEEAPKVVKFKLARPVQEKPKPSPVVIVPKKEVKTEPIVQKPEPKVEKSEPTPVIVPTKKETSTVTEPPKQVINEVEILFKRSETPLDKKDLWIECYNKALKSKKVGFTVDKIRRGRFSITEDNQVIFLSEYDTYGKSVGEILNDNWL